MDLRAFGSAVLNVWFNNRKAGCFLWWEDVRRAGVMISQSLVLIGAEIVLDIN
jgi:hypothetical protein